MDQLDAELRLLALRTPSNKLTLQAWGCGEIDREQFNREVERVTQNPRFTKRFNILER